MSKKLILIFALVFSFAVVGAAQTKPKRTKTEPKPIVNKTPKNVVDFFLLLPNKYAGNYALAKRQKYLKNSDSVTDTANGYLEIFGQTEKEPNIYVAIFKKDAGGYLVTVATGAFDNQKMFNYYFLDYNNNKWSDVSKSVLPADFKFADFYQNGEGNAYPCELPRYNRTINCRDKDGKITYLGWTGKDFVIE